MDTSTEHTPPANGTPIGPQRAAAEQVLEVDAVPLDASDAGDAGATAPSDAEWEAALGGLFAMLFGLAALRWRSFELPPEKLAVLTKAWVPVAKKHWQTEIPVELVAAGATAAIVLPCATGAYLEELQRSAERKARAAAHEDATRTSDRGTVYVGRDRESS